MSDFLKLVYDESHMKAISKLYSDGADKIEEAHKNIDTATQNLKTYYEGNGKLLFDETAKAVYEHLKLLETCTRAMKKYVDNAYEAMKSVDESMSKSNPYSLKK